MSNLIVQILLLTSTSIEYIREVVAVVVVVVLVLVVDYSRSDGNRSRSNDKR